MELLQDVIKGFIFKKTDAKKSDLIKLKRW